MPLTERDQRTLKIGGAIVGVLLLAFLLMNLLGGGDKAPPGAESTRPPAPPSPDANGNGDGDGGPSATATPSVSLSPVAVFTGRDPFSVPPGFSVSPTTTTTSPTGGTTSPTTTSTSPTGGTTTTTTTTTSPPTQPGNGSSTNKGGHEVVLLNVFSVAGVPTVQVEVDGTIYDVRAGEEFGPNDQFEVRSISGNCATFLFGDESFTLCVTPQK